MENSATIIIAIFLAAILMFIFPLMTMADKQDEMAKLAVTTATTEFTNKIRVTGKITQEDYDNFILALAATGNAYDVEIIIQVLDENPAKKSTTGTTTIGNNVYYVEFTSQVLKSLPRRQKEGDMVTVKVKNTNTTIFGELRNFVYRVTGNTTGTIAADMTVMVTKTAQ